MADAGLIAILGGLHLMAISAGVGLLVLALREPPQPEDPGPDGRDGHGGGGSAPRVPRGGPPLDSGVPPAVRLRGPGRLADRRRRATERRTLPHHHDPREPARHV